MLCIVAIFFAYFVMFVFYGSTCVFNFVLVRAVVGKFLFPSFFVWHNPLSCGCLVLCCSSSWFHNI
jgi:hypothetical protein